MLNQNRARGRALNQNRARESKGALTAPSASPLSELTIRKLEDCSAI